jgi:hypothetical protein
VMVGCESDDAWLLSLWTACTQADVSRLVVDYLLVNSSFSASFYLSKTESC